MIQVRLGESRPININILDSPDLGFPCINFFEERNHPVYYELRLHLWEFWMVPCVTSLTAHNIGDLAKRPMQCVTEIKHPSSSLVHFQADFPFLLPLRSIKVFIEVAKVSFVLFMSCFLVWTTGGTCQKILRWASEPLLVHFGTLVLCLLL